MHACLWKLNYGSQIEYGSLIIWVLILIIIIIIMKSKEMY
jgi:hypothetical protein